MGDTFKREFSLGQVDTGDRMPVPTTPPFIGGGLDPGLASIAGPQAQPGVPITRPTFLSAFLQNLGPALGGAMQAPRGSGLGGGIAGGFQGIQEQERYEQQVRFQQSEIQRRRALEESTLKHQRAMDEFLMARTGAVGEPKNQVEALSREYTEALDKGDKPAADAALEKITALSGAKSTAKPDPIAAALQAASNAAAKGDKAEFNKQLDLAHTLSTAKAPARAENEISLIQKANAGNPEAQQALDTLQARRKEIAKSRGGGWYANFYDPELQRNVRMSNEDAAAAGVQGKALIPAGAVPAIQLIQTQRAQSVIPIRIAEVEKYIKAWDNPTDRAIFARAVKDTPALGTVDHQTWLGNMLSQALLGKLSDDGRHAAIALRALNEAMGSVRVITGLPSTVGSMAATLSLVPGPQTPDSKFAREQLRVIRNLVEIETGVPFFGMGKKSSGGERVIDLRR